MDNVILEQGMNLMLYGMGSVFVFLTLLVAGTTLMSGFISKYMPEDEPAVLPPKTVLSKRSPAVDPTTLAVIQDAIHQHRAKSQ